MKMIINDELICISGAIGPPGRNCEGHEQTGGSKGISVIGRPGVPGIKGGNKK